MKSNTITLKQARRLAINAQGFEGSEKTRYSQWSRLKSSLMKTQLLQIDSVNALCRSHYLPLFSRLGLYRHSLLDKYTLAQTNREVFEYWGHEASLIPLDLHPLFRWRMQNAREGKGVYKMLATFARENPAYLKQIYQRVKSEGPTTAGQLTEEKKSAGWWQWSKSKMALEYLFSTGKVCTSHRHNFQRFYDISERVIPTTILNATTPKPIDAHKQLILKAAQAHGVATEPDLRDYFRLSAKDCKLALAELLEDKQLDVMQVESWVNSAFIPKGLSPGKQIRTSALLSPFDPLVWFRDRGERLFDFHYRLEIYTPAKKRKFGYYVLPVLHREQLIGRIDVKTDRQSSTLLVHAIYVEKANYAEYLISALLKQLPLLMQFLNLELISIAGTHQWEPTTSDENKLADSIRSAMQLNR